MNQDQLERFLGSFERIADSLEKISATQQRTFERSYPERKEVREAVISRVKTEEDLARERQGFSDRPISEWFGGFEDEEYIGEHEKAFLEQQRQQNASSSVGANKGQDQRSNEKIGRKARGRRKRSTDNSTS